MYNLHSVTSNAVFNTLSNVPVPVYWQDANHKDPLAEADAIATNAYSGVYSRFASFRLGNENSVNTPYGSGDTDFYYQLYKIDDSNYISMRAFDIISNRVYTISKVNGTWGSWYQIQFVEYLLLADPIITNGIPINFANVRFRNGVYHLTARFLTDSAVSITEGQIIGRLRSDYYMNPSWDFPVNVHNFSLNEDYLLWIYNNGDIRIFGIGTRTVTLDFYIDTTYVK